MESKSAFNMTPGVTPISHDVYDLHMLLFWICVGIAVIVFGLMIYSLLRHRKSVGHQAAKFHENTGLEILWAVIPFIILIIIAIPATKVLINMDDDADAALNIKITGYQWKWKYEYLDQGISFMSNLSTPQDELQNLTPKSKWYLLEVDHPLVLPVGEKIRFLITSNDVIHSWWVPALGVKKDAIPGFIHEAWAKIEKPGIYRGQCAELCGTNHGFMPIVVEAVTKKQFEDWVKQQKSQAPQLAGVSPSVLPSIPKEELIKTGKTAYEKNCAVCHKDNGEGMPPAFPALKGSKIVNGPLQAQIELVLNGKPGTAMQAFGKILNNQEIAEIITYQRNSWGNHPVDNTVQPSQIKTAREAIK